MYCDNCIIEVVNESSKFGFLPEQKQKNKKQNLVRQTVGQHTTTTVCPQCVHSVSTVCLYTSYIFNNDVMLNRFNKILDNLPAVVLA